MRFLRAWPWLLLVAAVWVNALLLRAVVAVGGATFVLVYLPQSALFEAIARWCRHEVVPLLAMHLGLSGHPLAHAAHALPTLALAASLMWLIVGLARAWVGLRTGVIRCGRPRAAHPGSPDRPASGGTSPEADGAPYQAVRQQFIRSISSDRALTIAPANERSS